MISERSLYLHVLRLFSACVVVLGHAKEFFFVHPRQGDPLYERLIHYLLSLGGSAVLVFFFLSGYLVGGKELRNLAHRSINLKRYLFDRTTRLEIVLIPALMFTYLLNYITCGKARNSLYCQADLSLWSHGAVRPIDSQSPLHFFSNIFFLQGFKSEVWGGNGPLWSLSFEFWYYVVFISVLTVVSNIRQRKLQVDLLFSLPVLALSFFILDTKWLEYGLAWILGAAIPSIMKRIPMNAIPNSFKIFSYFKFVLLLVLFVLPSMLTMLVVPLLPAIFIMGVLLIGSLCLTGQESQLRTSGILNSIIIKGSGFSFSLYLIHFPLLALAASYVVPMNRWDLTPIHLLYLAMIFLTVLGVAYLFAQVTEFRLASLRKRLVPLFFKG